MKDNSNLRGILAVVVGVLVALILPAGPIYAYYCNDIPFEGLKMILGVTVPVGLLSGILIFVIIRGKGPRLTMFESGAEGERLVAKVKKPHDDIVDRR